MSDPAQRATLVLENVSALEEVEDEIQEKPWCLVGYLIYDNGLRKRSTIQCFRSRDDAAAALEKMWSTMVG